MIEKDIKHLKKIYDRLVDLGEDEHEPYIERFKEIIESEEYRQKFYKKELDKQDLKSYLHKWLTL